MNWFLNRSFIHRFYFFENVLINLSNVVVPISRNVIGLVYVLYETPPTLKLNEYSPFCSYLLTRSQFSADLKCFGCKKNELISSIQNKLIKICNITTINLRMKLYCSKVSTGDGWCPHKRGKYPNPFIFGHQQ